MKEWHFEDKVFRRYLVVMVGEFEDFKEEMRRIELEDWEGLHIAEGYCLELKPTNTGTDQNCIIIWLPSWKMSSLVHELVHAVNYFLCGVGIELDHDHSEAHAFYMEYWFREIDRARRRMPGGRTAAQCHQQK